MVATKCVRASFSSIFMFTGYQNASCSSISMFTGYQNGLCSSTSRLPGNQNDLCSNIGAMYPEIGPLTVENIWILSFAAKSGAQAGGLIEVIEFMFEYSFASC